MSTIVLLGPQRFTPTLGDAVASAGVTGRLVSVTAGWQEREAEDLELHEHLGQRTVNLQLYARSEDVFERDPELFEAHRERQERLKELQRLYRARLAPLREVAAKLLASRGDERLLGPERSDAVEALARLDAHHLGRVAETNAAFEARWHPRRRPALERHRAALDRLLRRAEGICIAGGHVAILINRLRLFGLDRAIGQRAVFAWSAGAMAACERIVLFHDSPPQGEGFAEVLERGLGLATGLLALPHAERRLALDDRERVGLFARRFEPDLPLALADGARLRIRDGRIEEAIGVRRLLASGELASLEAA